MPTSGTHCCRLRGSLSDVNKSLESLRYMTPENSNDKVNKQLNFRHPLLAILIHNLCQGLQSLADKIIVYVFDNGSGGLSPYNVPFNATVEIELFALDENDAPICALPPYALVVQNASSLISGGVVLDVDLWEYQQSTYRGLLSASEVHFN
jgi:hypothetical protein